MRRRQSPWFIGLKWAEQRAQCGYIDMPTLSSHIPLYTPEELEEFLEGARNYTQHRERVIKMDIMP